MERELAQVVDDRVAGVVARRIASDDRRVLGKEVDHTTLALVTPLAADDNKRWHSARPDNGALAPLLFLAASGCPTQRGVYQNRPHWQGGSPSASTVPNRLIDSIDIYSD